MFQKANKFFYRWCTIRNELLRPLSWWDQLFWWTCMMSAQLFSSGENLSRFLQQTPPPGTMSESLIMQHFYVLVLLQVFAQWASPSFIYELSFGKLENQVTFICVWTSHKGVTQIERMNYIQRTNLVAWRTQKNNPFILHGLNALTPSWNSLQNKFFKIIFSSQLY